MKRILVCGTVAKHLSHVSKHILISSTNPGSNFAVLSKLDDRWAVSALVTRGVHKSVYPDLPVFDAETDDLAISKVLAYLDKNPTRRCTFLKRTKAILGETS